MSKKLTKTTEELAEEFFAAERAEYEKREQKAFPRVPVNNSKQAPDEVPAQADSGDKAEEEQKPARKTAN